MPQVTRTKSANFRQQTRKGEGRQVGAHRLEYRLVTGGEEVLNALDTLIILHDARWNGASAAFNPKRRAFHEKFSVVAAKRGCLRSLLVTLNGELTAAWLGYRYGGVESSYLMGRAPQWSTQGRIEAQDACDSRGRRSRQGVSVAARGRSAQAAAGYGRSGTRHLPGDPRGCATIRARADSTPVPAAHGAPQAGRLATWLVTRQMLRPDRPGAVLSR